MALYLVAADVLPLAGYPETYDKAAESLKYAESLINGFVDVTFGALSSGEAIRRHLKAKSYYIQLPPDVQSVSAIAPNSGSYTLELDMANCLSWTNGDIPQVFDAGWYKITVDRGITTIPETVNKAASLLAAHYLTMSDPERSRFATFAQGDVAGNMRLNVLPVPEAEGLLRKFREVGGVTVI